MQRALLIVSLSTACILDLGDVTYKPPQDAALAPDCTTYCTDIVANCTGANAQYGGSSPSDVIERCMATCGHLPAGVLSDLSGNTIGCRSNQSNSAQQTAMPSLHCPQAGPGGDQVDGSGAGACGSPCTSFCTIEIAACGPRGATQTGQYADMADCATACTRFDKNHKYTIDTTMFPASAPTGDSLACRLYYATSAAMGAGFAMEYCPATAAVATGSCAGPAMP
jgi:hypothetical protein